MAIGSVTAISSVESRAGSFPASTVILSCRKYSPPRLAAIASVWKDGSIFPSMTGSAFSPSHAAADSLPCNPSTWRTTLSSGPGMSIITSLALAACKYRP